MWNGSAGRISAQAAKALRPIHSPGATTSSPNSTKSHAFTIPLPNTAISHKQSPRRSRQASQPRRAARRPQQRRPASKRELAISRIHPPNFTYKLRFLPLTCKRNNVPAASWPAEDRIRGQPLHRDTRREPMQCRECPACHPRREETRNANIQ